MVSLLHHFLQNHSLGETSVHLHADNCSGQNKNNCMVQVINRKRQYMLSIMKMLFTQYLMWRVLTGLHQSITLSFMMVGHTKFAPDWCFGLVKRRLRRERVSCLQDLAAVVEASAEANVAELVGTEDGATNIPVYNWSTFLAPHFRKIPRLKTYHHISISHVAPGTLSLKLAADSGEEQLPLLKHQWAPTVCDLPAIIPPPGLSRQTVVLLWHQLCVTCLPSSLPRSQHRQTVVPL